MKNKLYVMVGLPISGKTTIAKGIQNAEVVSFEKVREDFCGEWENTEQIMRIAEERLVNILKSGKNAVYDACNISSKRRRVLLQDLKKINCEKTCVIAATPYETCLLRNKGRRKNPEEIKKMYMNWSTPGAFEGWDKIDLVYADGAKGSLGDPYQFAKNLLSYDQMNPFHKETLGEHMINTWKAVAEEGYEKDSNFAFSALIHDCGKPFTKFIREDKGGNKTAHYYQHQCVGGYDSLFFDFKGKTNEDILEISLLVNLHMSPFSWEKEENKRLKKLWGEELYKNVLLIHNADKKASIN